MIVLFTDFGLHGPYVGQMTAVLHRDAPGVPVVNLFADAPAQDPRAAAYLLAAYAPEFPAGTVFLCVVDPGVGGDRAPLVCRADERWFVGPDNGLFAILARRARETSWQTIEWRPETLSATFHGRDLFAPAAARLATVGALPGAPLAGDQALRPDWPDELLEIIYIDHFGNAIIGARAASLPWQAVLEAGGGKVERARTFSDVAPGEAFWFENANGLAEIAVNKGRAADLLNLAIGQPVALHVSL